MRPRLRFRISYRVLLAASLGVALVLAAYKHYSPDGQLHTWFEPEYRRLGLRMIQRHVYDYRVLWSYIDAY